MFEFATNCALILLGYAIGSIATAVVACRWMGLPDPRTQGSGNPGATNVLRLGGKKAAIITLAGDMLKGVVPLLLGHAAGVPAVVLAAIGMAAFLGHLFPIFFGFRGGKGVATALGVLLGLQPPLALATLATWLLAAAISRYSSLSALIAAALAPVYALWIDGTSPVIVVTSIMSILLIWRHRGNIRNLLDGREEKFGKHRA